MSDKIEINASDAPGCAWIIIAIALCVFLFLGEPDVTDALISRLMCK